VAAGLAEKCEVQIAYAIGVAEPVSVNVSLFDSGKKSEEEIVEMIKKVFPLKPVEMVEQLGLKRPIYLQTAAYGHFGRNAFPWESLDKVDE